MALIAGRICQTLILVGNPVLPFVIKEFLKTFDVEFACYTVRFAAHNPSVLD